jgi:hypothetical protein
MCYIPILLLLYITMYIQYNAYTSPSAGMGSGYDGNIFILFLLYYTILTKEYNYILYMHIYSINKKIKNKK